MVFGLESLIEAVQHIPCTTVSSMKAIAASVNSQFCSVSWTSMKQRMCGGTQIDRIRNRFTYLASAPRSRWFVDCQAPQTAQTFKMSWFFSDAYFCSSQSVNKKQNYRCDRWWVFHSTDNSMVHCSYAIRTTFSRSNSFFLFVSSIFRFRVHTILYYSPRSVVCSQQSAHPIYVGFKLEWEEKKRIRNEK